MSFSNSTDTEFAIKKLVNALAKPIAVILVFIALVLFLLKVINNISPK